ncbi:unnamed protein product [Cyclocybe aegerita]|uniref:Uncharacterized protein n=1 Tax=Cyclocybe aegerita TaxID=1973307 RepID=A0A8S0WAE6_CYCAE|nr:unnamed protein product [Cyclocybe aegerita]
MVFNPRISAVEHSSTPDQLLYPYLIASDASATYSWKCDGSQPTLRGKLLGSGAFTQHINIGMGRVLSLDRAPQDSKTVTILYIHDLDSGALLDRKILFQANSIGGIVSDGEFLGEFQGKIAVFWATHTTEPGGLVEIHTISEEGKFKFEEILHPPAGLASKMSNQFGNTSSYLLLHSPRGLLEVARDTNFPTAIQITRWSKNARDATYRTIPFASPTRLTNDSQKKWSAIHGFVTLPETNAFALANYESYHEGQDPCPSTVVRSIDADTLRTNWEVIVQHRSENIRYIPHLNVLLSFSYDDIFIVDIVDGTIKNTYGIPQLQRPCGSVWGARGADAIDVTESGKELGVVCGDGQMCVIPLEAFVESGFQCALNEEGKLITRPFPDLPISRPKSDTDRQKWEKGHWAWVRNVFFADQMVILQAGDQNPRPGFVVVSWD